MSTPTMILAGALRSTNTQRVLVVLHQLGLLQGKDYTWQAAKGGEIKESPWLEKQPFGAMPYLIDDGLVIYESRAICKCDLAAKYKSPLLPLPSDLPAYAAFERACYVEVLSVDVNTTGIAFERIIKGWQGKTADEARVKTLRENLANKLKVYEETLSKSRYIAGDSLTLADLFHLPYTVMAAETGEIPALVDGSLPNVARWWKELTELEAWKATVPAKL